MDVGRPVLVTANDRANQVFNGDTGVVVEGGDGMVVALATGDGVRTLAPSRLDRVETWWAMTIHKSQGSEFPARWCRFPTTSRPSSPASCSTPRSPEHGTVCAS